MTAQSGQAGTKIALSLAFILSLVALGAAGYLYQLVNTERRERQALEASQVQFQEKAEALQTEADHYRTEIEGLREQVTTLKAERDQLKAENEKNQSEIAAFQVQVTELSQRPETLSPPPQPGETPQPVAPKSPKVMTVNRKFKFAVVNVGSKDNLKTGDALKVERDGKQIANLKVEKLYDNFSAATIVEELNGATITEGDSIVRA